MTVSVPMGSSADVMTVDGYKRVFAVLEACQWAESVPDFKAAVANSMHSTYGMRYVTFFAGRSLSAAFDDGDAMFVGADSRARRLMREYQSRWRPADPYATGAAMGQLTNTGVAVLSQLRMLPSTAVTYVRDFLGFPEIGGSAAMRIALPTGGVGLVGLFDPDTTRLSAEDVVGLHLLACQLSVVARSLSPVQRPDPLAGVAGRPRDVAVLVGDGLTNAAIGKQLHLAEDTVKKYVSRVLAATGSRSRTELALLLKAA